MVMKWVYLLCSCYYSNLNIYIIYKKLNGMSIILFNVICGRLLRGKVKINNKGVHFIVTKFLYIIVIPSR